MKKTQLHVHSLTKFHSKVMNMPMMEYPNASSNICVRPEKIGDDMGCG